MLEKIPFAFENGKSEDIELIDGDLQKVDLGQLADWIEEYRSRI